MRLAVLSGLLIGAGCGSVHPGTDASQSGDAANDAPTALGCDPTAKFGSPMPVDGLAATGVDELSARLSPDELTVYFTRTVVGGDFNLYAARRAVITDKFGTLAPITLAESPSNDMHPTVSSDGLALWFESIRLANTGARIYISTRGSVLGEFGGADLAGVVNETDPTQNDGQPFVTADGKELWLSSSRGSTSGDSNLWRSVRVGGAFTDPVPVPELSSASTDWLPMLSADRLTVYFASDRPGTGTKGGFDIWTAHRTAVDDGFQAPVVAEELNTSADDYPSWLSADNCRMYLTSRTSGTDDIYLATRPPRSP